MGVGKHKVEVNLKESVLPSCHGGMTLDPLSHLATPKFIYFKKGLGWQDS